MRRQLLNLKNNMTDMCNIGQEHEEPVNGYCGSLFVAHCTNEQLIEC